MLEKSLDELDGGHSQEHIADNNQLGDKLPGF